MFKSKTQKRSLVWGGLLIFSGLAALIENYIGMNAWIWASVLFLLGLFTFIIYLIDRSDLLLLLPTYVLWAVAGLIAGVVLGIFWNSVVVTYVLAAIALPFLWAYLRNRQNWGLLIPAYVLLVIAVMVPGIDNGWLPEAAIPLYVLTAIALPFIVGYLRKRDNWGLLIPAYVLLAVGLMVMLIAMRVLNDLLIPAYVMLAVAVPFFVVYLRDTSVRWPLIPGGIVAAIGVSFLIAENAVQYVAPAALILAGVWLLVGGLRRTDEAPAVAEDAAPPALEDETPAAADDGTDLT